MTLALFVAVDGEEVWSYTDNYKDYTLESLHPLAKLLLSECSPHFFHLLQELWRLRKERPEWNKFKESVLSLPISLRASSNRDECPVHGVDRDNLLNYDKVLRTALLDKLDPVTIMNSAPTSRWYTGKAREVVKCHTEACVNPLIALLKKAGAPLNHMNCVDDVRSYLAVEEKAIDEERKKAQAKQKKKGKTTSNGKKRKREEDRSKDEVIDLSEE